MHRQIGEDAFRTLKRDYYAGRMAVIERHFEVEFYSQEVSAQTGRMAPPLSRSPSSSTTPGSPIRLIPPPGPAPANNYVRRKTH